MRTPCMALSVIFSVLAGSAIAVEVSLGEMPAPGAVAISQNTEGEWIYKSFPFFLPLYVFDGEPAGKSTCDEVCAAVWPIVRAEENDRPVGLWTIVKRTDGRLQWAFKNRAVYTYFEDIPGTPKGAGKDMDWYLDNGAVAYLRTAGVRLPTPANSAALKKGRQAKMTAALLKP
jgi:predicted lipoprotein with Yx(FWY)xxD motif